MMTATALGALDLVPYAQVDDEVEWHARHHWRAWPSLSHAFNL